MTAIWRNDGTGWRILPPSGFPDERALHTLVEEAPHLLPLAGSPTLAVIGREVRLGAGFADLLAVEADGRLCVIEVKLQRNPEARRAVVSQVLTYAAFLRGTTREALEGEILRDYLSRHQWKAVDDALAPVVPEGGHDPVAFDAALRSSLAEGRFRLVLVLDDAPPELVRLVGYLEAVAGLTIDLLTVSPYEVANERLLIPQRVDPDRTREQDNPAPAGAKPPGRSTTSSAEFERFLEGLPAERQSAPRRLLEWVHGLEVRALTRAISYVPTSGPAALLPYVSGEDVGLVTVYSDGRLQLWRSVFERRAPTSTRRVEDTIAPALLRQGGSVKDPSEETLLAVTDAYVEAASGGRQLQADEQAAARADLVPRSQG